jgi:hypothetical protein
MVDMVNDLLRRGAPQLSKDRRYLTYADGTPFFYLADTWWFGATGRMSWTAFKLLVALRKRQGFTAVQIVVGYPPEIPVGSPHARNQGGWALNTDKSINYDYFVDVDRKIAYLVKNGIVPVIVGSWGYHLDIFGEVAITRLWKEIVARYSKYPVIWCLCGEVDLMSAPAVFGSNLPLRTYIYQLLKKCIAPFPFATKIVKSLKSHKGTPVSSRIEKWAKVAHMIKSLSANLLMVHIFSRQTSVELFNRPPWLDINTIQSGHTNDGLDFMIQSARSRQANKLPFINLEPRYQRI